MLSDINISHGSVATPLRCGGICNDGLIANFLLSVTVKECWKNVENRSLFGKVMDKSLVSCFYWTTVYKRISKLKSHCHTLSAVMRVNVICIRTTALRCIQPSYQTHVYSWKYFCNLHRELNYFVLHSSTNYKVTAAAMQQRISTVNISLPDYCIQVRINDVRK